MEDGDTNLYAYVGNDPINLIDPSGTDAESFAIGVGAAVGADIGFVLGGGAGVLAGVGSGGVGFAAIPATAGLGAVGGAAFGALLGEGLYQGSVALGDALQDIFNYAKKTGKEKATDIPSWAKGQRPQPGEAGKDFADRLCSEKYGPGNYPTGPGSEHSKIKKWGDRGF